MNKTRRFPKKELITKKTMSYKVYFVTGLLLTVALLVVFSCIKLQTYLEQQKTLRELDSASQGLRTVYDNLLLANVGNVKEAYFQNECNQASAKLGNGQISCGVTGRVILQKEIAISEARTKLDSSSMGSKYYTGPSEEIAWTSKPSLQMHFNTSQMDISAYGSYGLSQLTQDWSFTIGSRKTVPNFLPGYKIVD